MASVNTFKDAVLRIRDLLRTDGITGMDSMRHISLYLMSRYVTRANVAVLKIPEVLAWETIIEEARSTNANYALARFFNKFGNDCLVQHFDQIFETQDFTFLIKPDAKGQDKHFEILKILDAVNMSQVECEMDLLGWVYEQHLATGASKSRDLGQFFTDRAVCTYMVDLCNPGFKYPGVPESVCDPTMGTAGFLTTYIKHYKKQGHAVNWAKQIKEIHGCEIAGKVAAIARMNIFMETNGCVANSNQKSETLLTINSLYIDLPRTQYDVILANMPFGIKGITHAECCDRVKDLKIRGTKAEPLFLQLICVSLAHNGRAAVIVPDGMLMNKSSCHDGTRKYLMDNFELKRVVKMSGKFFMNTGIKPSILFFENTGRPTSAVEFWEIERDAFGEIRETLLLTVPREKFDASHSLDMRRYIPKPVVAVRHDYPTVKLGDIITYKNGNNIPEKNRTEIGNYSYYASNGVHGYVDKFNFQGHAILIGDQGSNWAKSVHWVEADVKFYAGNHTVVMNPCDCTQTNARFVYYYLKLADLYEFTRPSLIPEMDKEMFFEMRIPLPPLHIQEEIVATLDRLYHPGTTELADTLKLTDRAMDLVLANGAALESVVDAQRLVRKSTQMVADINAQMVAIMRTTFTFPSVPISELYEIPSKVKKFNSGDMDNEGDSPFYSGKWNSPTGTHSEHSFHSENNYFVGIKDGGGDHTSATVGLGMFFDINGRCSITSHNIILAPKTENAILHRFVYYCLKMRITEMRDKARYSLSLGSISVGDILDFAIQLPPLHIQEQVVAKLEALQSSIDSLETLKDRSEDNARFILESYLS